MDKCTNCKKPVDPNGLGVMAFRLLQMAFCNDCRTDPHTTRILAGQVDPPLDLW